MSEITQALQDFAARYTAAWCSQDAAAVASFFATEGSLTINHGTPAIGRSAITAAAQSFMTAFPDLEVRMNCLVAAGERIEYHWMLTGTNTGPRGTGNRVHISGFESWNLDADGLILESLGHFDQSEYDRQLANKSGSS